MTLDSRYLDELGSFMIGEKLGAGCHRDVHVFLPDPSKVIKIDRSGNYFANVSEWSLWSEVCDTKAARWFAPIFGISRGGLFLVQARTTPCVKLPKKLPSFFSDVKRANFGHLDGKLVAHDYANHSIYARGLADWSLTPVEEEDLRRS